MEQTTENTALPEEITGLARPELIQVADAVAREKAIDREEVLTAMEQAIQKAGRSRYGQEHDIRAAIDRSTGHAPPPRRTRTSANPIASKVFVINPAILSSTSLIVVATIPPYLH